MKKTGSRSRHSGYNTSYEEQFLTPKNNEPKPKPVDDEMRARREFLKRIGKGSAAVPAAALLLAASAKQAQAVPSGGCGC
jgi:hypothetical protein